MNISAVLACHNEEPFILSWLEETSAYAREILIAVNAPTDRTADIIARFKSHSPVPIHCEWFPAQTVARYGFAVMKNEMISRATGDWVTSIDADEEIGLTATELAGALESTTAAGCSALALWWAEHPRPRDVPVGWSMERHRYQLRSEHRPVYPPLRKCNVFRNRAGYWWRGIIHEVIARYGRKGLEFCHDVGAFVHHYGYLRRPEPGMEGPAVLLPDQPRPRLPEPAAPPSAATGTPSTSGTPPPCGPPRPGSCPAAANGFPEVARRQL